MNPLEHRLRRWLRLYPIDQREEILGVLLATAGPGRERPSPRDAADLVGGAVRVRLNREIRSLSSPIWRDAFAVLSLVTTLLLFTGVIDLLRDYNGHYSLVQPPPAPVWPMWAPWIIVAVLSVRGLRRTAAGLAWAAALSQLPWLAVSAGGSAFEAPFVYDHLFWFGLAVIAAAALSVSDGLRRALPLLGRWRVAALAIGVGGFAYVVTGIGQRPPRGSVVALNLTEQAPLDPRWLFTLAPTVLIIAAVVRLRTAYGRRAAAVLVPSLAPLLCSLTLWLAPPDAPAVVIVDFRLIGPVAVVLLIGATAVSHVRERRRSTS
ncbi:hypothetical protein NE236_41080 [Actinoallomurus purpureus]|uniref:hypothetical protein n=1 Tax=Actinoallomurus purpureus TaxID=478114 RepID=UPI002092CC99|nr:hypothetical protein [Actinoallomurus purpureus]MCO6011362.1 hypothetical protein [Actinoallomurus purpureus]